MKEWEEFLAKLERQLGPDIVRKWIPKCVRFDAANVFLETKDSFQISWFEEHVRPRLKGLVNQNQRPIRVHLLRDEKTKIKKTTDTPQFTIHQGAIDPEMTLENFVTKQENLVVHSDGARCDCTDH